MKKIRVVSSHLNIFINVQQSRHVSHISTVNTFRHTSVGEMPELTELDDDDYDGMPDLCDNIPKDADEEPENAGAVGAGEELPKAVDDDGWEDVLGSGRLRKKVLRPGDSGRGRPVRGASCTINLRERLAGGREVDTREGEVLMVGESELIQGLDLVLPLMVPGELALVRMESSFGYGSGGDGARVPPNSELEVEVELVYWEEMGPVPDIARDVRMSIGSRKRERGNRHFSRGDFSTAVMCYRSVKLL